MTVLARLAGAVGPLAAVVLILIGSFFASGPILLALVRIFHIHSVASMLIAGTGVRLVVLGLIVIALVRLTALSRRRRSETLRRLEWRFTAAAGILVAGLMAKLLLAPVGISESTSSSMDARGHTQTVTHSTATYLLQSGVSGIVLGIVAGMVTLVLIAAILSLAYRDWRSDQSRGVPLLWIIAVAFQGAAIVTGFSIGFWFLVVPPVLMLGALAGSLAGIGPSPGDPARLSVTRG